MGETPRGVRGAGIPALMSLPNERGPTMDPNEALRELRAALADYHAASDDAVGEAAERVAVHAEALDGWLSKGGFLPRAWTKDDVCYDPACGWEQGHAGPCPEPLGPPNPAHAELPDPGYCLDCLQPRNPHADRHCRATSTRWDRTYHRWSNA